MPRLAFLVLNPIHLQTLQTVIRTGSFADAARQLGYTGSAVSQQMAALERQIRAALFERDAHRVRPTPAALFVAEQSLETLGRLRSLEEDIALLLEGATGKLRLGKLSDRQRTAPPRSALVVPRQPPQGGSAPRRGRT